MITFTREHLVALLDAGFSVKEIANTLRFSDDFIEYMLGCSPESYILLRRERYDRHNRG